MNALQALPAVKAAAVPTAPLPDLLVQAPAAFASVHEALARPVRLADPPLYEGSGLHTLHSVLRI